MTGSELWIYIQVESIKAEIEAAKLDNQVRLQQHGDTILFQQLNYPPEWFEDKSRRLMELADLLQKTL